MKKARNITDLALTEGARASQGGMGKRAYTPGNDRSLTTDKGDRIQFDSKEPPAWNDYHKRYYVWGNRMIRSRGTWSGVRGLHNFGNFTEDKDD